MATKTKKARSNGKGNGKQARRAPRLNPESKITVLSKTNPKREGSEAHKVFGLYRKHRTVGDFLKHGGTTAHVRWDAAHGFIKLG